MSDQTAPADSPGFHHLGLAAPVLRTLDELGYETPTPIQQQAIPHLMAGLDLLGHAPTGTGKTAAFALPLLSRLDLTAAPAVQVMALAPTRELAIQVAEAFKRYARHLPGFRVLPVYGGQEYATQLRPLKRGVHVVVGTPGRVVDHMRRGTLQLDSLRALVLDEADEMLRMGFIEEVEWILEQTPQSRQLALFSATMPAEVERIARRHLRDPREVSIRARTATAETIRQRYWQVSGLHKLDALTRILEVEPFEAVLIFVRTRTATVELAERLEARGFTAAAMSGELAQSQREQLVERLKRGTISILVATDVAARGLDVDRISHVINYDIPNDIEAYIHRIGRTGRAGRSGEAIVFVAPRERRMLSSIERATRQPIEALVLPTTETINNKRIAAFKQKITDTLAGADLAFTQSLVTQYAQEHDVAPAQIAAALAALYIGDQPLLLAPDRPRRPDRAELPARTERAGDREAPSRPRRERRREDRDAIEMERYRIEVGHRHGVKPGNIVGAIANEAGLDGEHIGAIEIEQEYSLIDLPAGMPKPIFMDLRKVRVCGEALAISRVADDTRSGARAKAGSKPKRPGNRPGPKGKGKPGPKRQPGPPARPGGVAKGRPATKGEPADKTRTARQGKAGEPAAGAPRKP